MVPELHPQWRGLDLADLLSKGAAFINMDAQNSILSPDGVLRHENLWRGAREPGGSFHNILRLAAACRTLAMPFIWLRYDRFVGEREPKSALDVVQYRAWNDDYKGDAARKIWESDLVEEVKAILTPRDLTMVYRRGRSSPARRSSAGSRRPARARWCCRAITPTGASRWRRAPRAISASIRSWSAMPAARRSRFTTRPSRRSTTATRRWSRLK